MLKLSLISTLFLCCLSCISRTERNKSTIQGYWEKESDTVNTDKALSLLYFSGGHAILRGYEEMETEFSVHDDIVNFKFHRPFRKESTDLEMQIISLSYHQLVLVVQEDTLVYHRKSKINSGQLVSLSLASASTENLEIEISENLNCKAGHTHGYDTLKKMVIPEWKWFALKGITESIKLKSFRSNMIRFECGGEFAFIIETDKSGTYEYYGVKNHPNANELEFLTGIIWQTGCSAMIAGEERKGKLKFHKRLMDLFGVPEIQRTLQFIPPS